MTKIQSSVWKFLDENPSIRKMIQYNIVNKRGLAKYIINEKKIYVPVDSVISAIRRYKIDENEDYSQKAIEMIKKTKSITSRSDISKIVLVKDSDVQKVLPDLFKIIRYNRGDVLRIIQGDGFIEVLTDSKNYDRVKDVFPQEKIIESSGNLSEIKINLTEEQSKTPGIIAIISNKLAAYKINVIEILACYLEYSWFVKQEDLMTAYKLIYDLCKSQGNS